MKTYKNLYPTIYTWEALETAYRKARKGKRRTLPVADFEYNWESNLLRLQAELAAKTYRNQNNPNNRNNNRGCRLVVSHIFYPVLSLSNGPAGNATGWPSGRMRGRGN